MSVLPFQRGGPGHAGFLQTGSQLLQGPVAAQVALGVRVEALFDPYVSPGLAPQMFGRLGEPGSLSAQRGALHARTFSFFFYCIHSLDGRGAERRGEKETARERGGSRARAPERAARRCPRAAVLKRQRGLTPTPTPTPTVCPPPAPCLTLSPSILPPPSLLPRSVSQLSNSSQTLCLYWIYL